jgi:predicted O-methyltransferase YrrM
MPIRDLTANFMATAAAVPTLFRRTSGDAKTARTSVRQAQFRMRSPLRAISVHAVAELLGMRCELHDVTLPASVHVDPAYCYVLAVIAAMLQPKRIVEFGTFLGWSTLTMALNAPLSQVFTVDLPDDASPSDLSSLNAQDKAFAASVRGKVGDAFKNHPCAGRVTQILANSLTLDITKHVEIADLIFVDGGHSYECVSADTRSALSVIRPGGLVVWDDYAYYYPEVVRVVEDLARERPIYRIDRSCFAVMVA